MSTDRPTLGDFCSNGESPGALHKQTLADAGAVYTADATPAPTAPQQAPQNACHNCGHDVPSHVARVVGDNNGCVPACDHCRSDVLSDEDLLRGNHSTTVALVHRVRGEMRGDGVDPNGGGRR